MELAAAARILSGSVASSAAYWLNIVAGGGVASLLRAGGLIEAKSAGYRLRRPQWHQAMRHLARGAAKHEALNRS
jgi:hypothetical protein